MKIVVSTEKFKDMVARVIKGAGNNKIVPITQLMGIDIKDGTLRLITTDYINYLYIVDKGEYEGDFSVSVPIEVFSKLISRITSKEITLEVKDNVLEVKGNGTYTIELHLDENGEIIKYPDPYSNFKGKFNKKNILHKSDIEVVLESVKPAITVTNPDPVLIKYYVGEETIAADGHKIAVFNKQLLNDSRLLSIQLIDLLDVMKEEQIQYSISSDTLVFVTDDCIIYSQQNVEADDYPVQDIKDFIATEFDSVCKVNKDDLIALLERISLFVSSQYDDDVINVKFDKNGIYVSNKSSKSSELVEYIDSKGHKDFECSIKINMLLSQLKGYRGDSVEIHYNNEDCIKFVDKDVIQFVALVEDGDDED